MVGVGDRGFLSPPGIWKTKELVTVISFPLPPRRVPTCEHSQPTNQTLPVSLHLVLSVTQHVLPCGIIAFGGTRNYELVRGVGCGTSVITLILDPIFLTRL